MKTAKKDFDWVRRVDGVLVLDTHIDRAGSVGLSFLGSALEELGDKTQFVRMKDVLDSSTTTKTWAMKFRSAML